MVQPARTRGIYQTARRRWISNWRFTLAFVIGLLLSIASFYTTWDGLVEFTAPDPHTRTWGSQALAVLIALGIQSIMLLSAWTVGMALVRGADPHRNFSARARDLRGAGLWTLMFLATLVFSVFFSYHAFYIRIVQFFAAPGVERITTDDAVSDAQARGNRSEHINNLAEIYVRRTVGASLSEMRGDTETQRLVYFNALTNPQNRPNQAILTKSPTLASAADAWRQYIAKMNGIISFGQESIKDISKQIAQQSASDLQQTIEDAEKKRIVETGIKGATSTSSAAASELKTVEEDLKKAKKSVEDLDKEIASHEEAAREAQSRMECESGGNKCRDGWAAKKGKKQRYRKAEKDRDDAELLRSQASRDRAAADKKRKELEADRDGLQGRLTAAGITEARNQAALGAISKQASSGTGGQLSMTEGTLRAKLEAMAGAISELSNPASFGDLKLPAPPPGGTRPAASNEGEKQARVIPLTRLETSCTEILAFLSNELFERVANQARKLSCAADGLSGAIGRIQRLNSGLRGFDEKQCQTLGRNYRAANTATLIVRGEDCLETVGLDGEKFDHFMILFADLKREHNQTVHPFVQSWHGVWTYNDKLAYLSLCIAAMVDLLVFCVGIAGGKESLRRIDRIGEELRGEEVLGLALAVSRKERTSDSESIRVARLILNRLVPQDYVPDPDNFPHIRYSGYIVERELQRGVEDDDLVRRQIQMWMSTPKSGIDLVLRTPRPEQEGQPPDSGLIEPEPEFEEEPVRFFFLRELVIDLAESIVHWDKAHASSGSDAAAAAPPPAGQRRRQSHPSVQQPPRPKASIWSWGRLSRRYSDANGINGAEARPPGTDQDFRIRRPDGSIAEAHSPAEDRDRAATNGSNGKPVPTEGADGPATAEPTTPHHLRRGS